MASYPGPGDLREPQDIATWRPQFITFSRLLFRCHSLNFEPLFFDTRASYRFNSPNGQFGVCYFGIDPECCFAETFLHDQKLTVITQTELTRRALARIRIEAPLNLLDLTAHGAMMIGADQRLISCNYTTSRSWVSEIHSINSIDGIHYSSRLIQNGCVAIFDRARAKISVDSSDNWLSALNASESHRILDKFDVGLISSGSLAL